MGRRNRFFADPYKICSPNQGLYPLKTEPQCRKLAEYAVKALWLEPLRIGSGGYSVTHRSSKKARIRRASVLSKITISTLLRLYFVPFIFRQ